MDFFGKATFNSENDAVGVAGPEYNRQQLFNFIESELLAILPTLKAPRTNQYGRLDQGFARMLLAKIYLNAEVYIGTAKYVLLGEASHGTHEYYTWRAKITQRLIQEKGFSFIGVEGDWPDCSGCFFQPGQARFLCG